MSTDALFACSHCLAKHPFDELSTSQQLCKECRGAFPIVKCTYCRSEFQQTSKENTNAICKKCEYNVKAYGTPSACEYCNIFAAFIGPKCQRCTNLEVKHGPPSICEHCKQKCAFYKQDDKILCWLCSLSLKKTLAKSKVTHMHVKLSERTSNGLIGAQLQPLMELQEQVASLQKQLNQRDQQLFNKDKIITALKAKNFTTETELRNKMRTMQRDYDQRCEMMHEKLQSLQKVVASLSKKSANNK